MEFESHLAGIWVDSNKVWASGPQVRNPNRPKVCLECRPEACYAADSRRHRSAPFGAFRSKTSRQCEKPMRIGALWWKSLKRDFNPVRFSIRRGES
ncbi:hypothetical protein AVEN_199622-1 [Araneus ventricosus]|uniref:Uncharacterized protein n=1 Tax=Araneus ventricosus TaxID=182803 RepID=A0A4Y2DH50_ARAVE|nr:hypothetical protein AVEN_199622-1 [Araneus ventricosus]